MGYLAYGHPFLDGNGRTILVVHADLAERAGISIDWAATGKAETSPRERDELTAPAKDGSTPTLSRLSARRLAGSALQAMSRSLPALPVIRKRPCRQ